MIIEFKRKIGRKEIKRQFIERFSFQRWCSDIEHYITKKMDYQLILYIRGINYRIQNFVYGVIFASTYWSIRGRLET